MSGSRVLGLLLVVVGAGLLYFGWNATRAPMERFSETLTGRYSDRTQGYLIGGGAALVVGLGLTLFGGGRRRR